jgi:soluble lytic murein transglycosylase-like protein
VTIFGSMGGFTLLEEAILRQFQPPAAQAILMDGPCAVSSRFPEQVRQWCVPITAYAAAHDLPPDLVAALVWQESNGNPEAVSHSGAVGLMQVMPSDGRAAAFTCRNGPCFADRPASAALRDPLYNLDYGTSLLADLMAHTGSRREALRAYGPMDVGYRYADTVLALYQQYKE